MPRFPPERQLLSRAVPWAQPPLNLILGQSVTAKLPQGKARPFVGPHFLPLWEPFLGRGTSASRRLSQGPKVERGGARAAGEGAATCAGIVITDWGRENNEGSPQLPLPGGFPLPTSLLLCVSSGEGREFFCFLFFGLWLAPKVQESGGGGSDGIRGKFPNSSVRECSGDEGVWCWVSLPGRASPGVCTLTRSVHLDPGRMQRKWLWEGPVEAQEPYLEGSPTFCSSLHSRKWVQGSPAKVPSCRHCALGLLVHG
jgi:hypothetical protein